VTDAGWVKLSRAADVMGIIGLIFAVVGFWVGWLQLKKIRSAAEAAQAAAIQARSKVLLVDSIVELTHVIQQLGDIEAMHRAPDWRRMPERYRAVSLSLVGMKTGNQNLSADQREILTGALGQVSAIAQAVEAHLAAPGAEPNVAEMNVILSEQAKELTVVLTELKIKGSHL
jgi:hypothetical protein